MSKQVRSIVIDSDANRRMRLKQAIAALSTATTVGMCSTVTMAKGEMERLGPVDVFFLAHSLGEDVIRQFVATFKEYHEARNAAFVVTAPASGIDIQAAIGRLLGPGSVDGFLVEPFSVEGLGDIIVLTERVKRERQEARERVAMRLLVHEIAEQIDGIWQILKTGGSALQSRRLLQETCLVLNDLSKDSLERYYDCLITEFSERRPPVLPSEKSMLRSPSARLRERAESQRVEQQLKAARAAAEQLRKAG